MKNGYFQCQADHTLFTKHSHEGKIAIIIVYVDDIILTGDYEEEVCNLKILLAKEFEVIWDISNTSLGWKLHNQERELLSHNVSMS